MILSDVQLRAERQFGDTAGAMITDADIARWATDAQLDIVRRTKLNETTTTMASVGLQSVYAVANMLEVIRVTYNGLLLKLISRAELDQRFPNRGVTGYGTDTPMYWRFTEAGIEVFPTPANNLGIVVVTHTKRPTPVVNPTDVFEIPEKYHEDIVRRVLERCYETDGQWNAADRMKLDTKERMGEAMHDKSAGAGDSFPSVRALRGDLGSVD